MPDTGLALSSLSTAELARLRTEAEREHSSQFTDPALIRAADRLLNRVSGEWLSYIVGRQVAGWRQLAVNAELHLAVAAARADAEHFQAQQEALHREWRAADARRGGEADAARSAAWAEWVALRDRLPVPVVVCHNWTARHYDGYEQGADHIVVQADIHAGRLHRAAHRELCWTPSRAHQLRHVSGNVGDENRVPDCKACLRVARQLAERAG